MKTKVLFFISLFLTILAGSSPALAQSSTKDEVVLTVSGEGKTTDEATKEALRSAISQAYGVFVSANTTLLNDDLVKDEIVTLTSGNIKNYEEVSNITLQNGTKSVTLKATVCISKLVSYAQSKGASTEFAGATFAMNMKMKELNKANEARALDHLTSLMAVTLPYCYDLKCEVGEPANSSERVDTPSYDIPLIVTFTPNQSAQSWENTFIKSLESISLTREEFIEYNRLNLHPTNASFERTSTKYIGNREGVYIYLRNNDEWVSRWLEVMEQIVRLEALNFVVKDNVGNVTSFTPKYDNERYKLDVEMTTQKASTIEFIYDGYRNMSYAEENGFNWSPFNRDGEAEFRYALFNSPQVLRFTMRIPQADISKYSNFNVQRAYDNLLDHINIQK